MIHDVIFSFWFLLPAATANVAPILGAYIPVLKNWQTPLDGGRTFRGKEILGSHKTWRGIVSGIIVATLVFWLQQIAFNNYIWARNILSGVDYSILPAWLLGPLFGIGALGGDALESFFKRQRGVKSGYSWIPFDQLDYIIGGVVVSLPFVILKPEIYVWIIVVWFVMHLLASYVGWKLGFKERPI